MIKPNWNIFQAKFSENPQDTFEWFSYLLFCKEFNKPYGIFRYKNQSAIETNPIENQDEIIGWQAKFYDVSISNHKADIIDTIEKAKRDYPNITRLLIYTNQEWGQTKGKTPKGLIEIEDKAKTLNLTLDWRMASFFESEFVCSLNKELSNHFFTLEKSIFNLIEEQEYHTKNIISEISSSINFNGGNIELDRNSEIEKLKDNSNLIKILSGSGGVGKTAIIKKLYEDECEESTFFIFKATEFELRNINDLFNGFSFYDFANIFENELSKTIVIDSAEKLLDLNNIDPFKEFLSILIKDKWKIIFTTREHYLENLNYDFSEIYKIAPININISNLDDDNLSTIAEKYSFSLPKDSKLSDLIKNPFYLNEYLKFYNDESSKLNYIDFKSNLWSRNIKKSNPERERCLLKTAFERATSGQFFVDINFDSKILYELVQNGILGYEEMGYFITHDIYEEWALEKIIDKTFNNSDDEQSFFLEIGNSLAIRRSFRNWLSEKLLLEDDNIKQFIESVLDNNAIESFWKDEIFVSILLSDYSEIFFDLFKNRLLENEQELLKRITFILRLACKEVDDTFFKKLGLKDSNKLSFNYVFTKPKGQGWESLVNFIFNNLEEIGIKNINFILPIVYDWNNNLKQGEITKLSSLISLQYYEWAIEEDVYWSRENNEKELLKTIINGSSEIKNELEIIFKNIIENKWKNHGDPYYQLSHMVLTELDGIPLTKIVPEYILKLADLFWSISEEEYDDFHRSSLDIGQYFGINENRSDYHPASAYQTPIYWLLQSDITNTIKFILNFTNKCVRKYASSSFDRAIEKVELHITDEENKKQYMSNCLWNMYRGVGSPVSPYLLQSIHMALEKFFLDTAKYVDADTIESWLLYLLKNSESASITSVVTSIVLAYPDKTFNIAKILFQTKEFIIEDTTRLVLENQTESLYSMAKNWGVNHSKFYDDERINTCKDKHRQWSLEKLLLNYQCFRSSDISEEEAEERQKILWGILDNYYSKLPEDNKAESTKTWRLFLARMDKRKMNIKTEKVDNGIQIEFNPVLEPDLKEYSEKAQEQNFEPFKYSSLQIWADYKFKKEDKYKQYVQYENNPKQALLEVKEIIELFNSKNKNENFILFNRATPSFVCSVILRDHINEIDNEDKEFCKDIISQYASSSFDENYNYQISDGIQQAFSVMPILIKEFPDESLEFKLILLLGLFKKDRVGGMLEDYSFSIFSIVAIQELWKEHFDEAQSLLLGYLKLVPKYKLLVNKVREENYKNNIYNFSNSQIIERLIAENEKDIQNIINGELDFEESNLNNLSLNDLNRLFKLIPSNTNNKIHKNIIKNIISTFSIKILSKDKEEKIDYRTKKDFLERYTFFMLNLPLEEIEEFLNPFIDNFNNSESMADLLREFVVAEDYLNTYDNFWRIWDIFKDNIIEIAKEGDGYWYTGEIIKSYLFAKVPWKENAKEWRSFNQVNKKFFKEISQKIGHCKTTLYSISKLLNDIGSIYLEDGINWISSILNNYNFLNEKLETNTIYYIEHLVKKYIFMNREKVRKNKVLKNKLLVILNFLIEKGSVTGYMLRESII